MGTDTINYQRTDQKQQTPFQIAKFVGAADFCLVRSQDLILETSTSGFNSSARTFGCSQALQLNCTLDFAIQYNLCCFSSSGNNTSLFQNQNIDLIYRKLINNG
ncbi:hypothetical protein GALL_553180 [mine drainage metagenome]|uniref:Uncharacterized protein n=1 Tax=mine drainage metagenome TaxID=410659 RepID=A0A1J5P5Q6_9ZZZZ